MLGKKKGMRGGKTVAKKMMGENVLLKKLWE